MKTKEEFKDKYYLQIHMPERYDLMDDLDAVIAQAIAEHEEAHIKLSPEIFNQVQLKRVARILKELSEESWKAAGGDVKEWIIWYKKRGTQYLNQPQEGGEG